MAIYRIFPLPEIIEELKPYRASFDITSNAGSESLAVIGDNPLLKSSILLQAALSYAEEGDEIIYIYPGHYPRPFPVRGMTRPTNLLVESVRFQGITEPLGLIKYLCEFHMTGILPSAIIIDDFFYHVQHHQEHNRDAAVAKLFALLEDVAAYVSEKREKPCHRLISLHRTPSPKSALKKYFQQVWHLSFTDKTTELMMTDEHIPAFRIYFHIQDDEIVMDKLCRLPSVDNS